MLICPISGFRMRQARAKGGTFWYCPHSRARMLTLEMAKHYLGVDAARELWVRSEHSSKISENSCPSCARPMRLVSEPGWLGSEEINICRGCHFFWFKPDQHKQIPHPEDLIVPQGDSTLLKDAGDAAKDYLLTTERAKEDREQIAGQGPDGLLASLPGFLGLPVEMNDQTPARWPWLTIFFTLLVFGLHAFLGPDSQIIQNWGFYPAEPFRHGGLNVITAVFLHGDWFHLVFNLYFFWIFADDVEHDLGPVKFLVMIATCAVVSAIGKVLLSGSPTVPHVGLSGVIMAMMTYYMLQFPKARIAYLLPGIHSMSLPRGGLSFLQSWRWYRLPVWIAAGFYIGKDIFKYLVLERQHLTSTSHAAHLSGVVGGFLFWLVFSKAKAKAKDQTKGLVPLVEATSKLRLPNK